MGQGGQGSQVPVITRRGSWSGEPSQPREAMGGPRVVGPCLQGNEGTSGRSTPRHTPGFQTRGQSSRRDEGDGEAELAPRPPPRGARHVCCLFSWQAGRGSRQAERAGRGGCPSSPFLGTHSCTCTHTPCAGMRPLPALPLRTGRGSTSPLLLQASREGTLPSVGCGGLRLNWDGPRAPGPPGSLAGSHNTPRLAPLSANRTLWVGGKRGPLPAESPGQRGGAAVQSGGVFGCRAQGLACLGLGGGDYKRGFGGALLPSRALTLQAGVVTPVPSTL